MRSVFVSTCNPLGSDDTGFAQARPRSRFLAEGPATRRVAWVQVPESDHACLSRGAPINPYEPHQPK